VAVETRRTALITGATGGIGKAVALQLARDGYRVFATGRRQSALDVLLSEVEEGTIEAMPLDVTAGESIREAAQKVHERTGGRGLDVLVNNAGYGITVPMELIAEEDLRGQLETNVIGLVRVSQAFLPAMRERGSGTVINISSMVGRVTLPMQGVYCASKHAVEAISDAMRQELLAFGVRVVVVEPGAVRTSFTATATSKVQGYASASSPYEQAFQNYQDGMERMYRNAPGPEVIARAISRILRTRRPRARYIVPWAGMLALWLFRLLPTRWIDRLMSGMLGLRKG
jgi:short-subunit dehydrogenase